MHSKNTAISRDPQVISRRASTAPRHGGVDSPPSRAYLAEAAGLIEGNRHYGLESGKFFPETAAGLQDPFAPEDDLSALPPPDGQIASAGQPSAAYLDRMDVNWTKHKVYGGEYLDVTWRFSARHKSRRFNYFITRKGWKPSEPLSRAQFETTPFATFQNPYRPHWSEEFQDKMLPDNPTLHSIMLPAREGYHVVLAVWEVAETGNAFYQVIDLEFLANGGGSRPDTPTGFSLDGTVTFDSVGLKWNPASGPHPVDHYLIRRNGALSDSVSASLTNYTDRRVQPLTHYSYTITAVDNQGNESLPSSPVEVTTPGKDGENPAPGAPSGLHDMGVSQTMVDLMWTAPEGSPPLTGYILYRDGQEVRRVPSAQVSARDAGLTPDTVYRYTVTALGTNGLESGHSNTHTVRTQEGEPGEYPAWTLKGTYKTNDIVRHEGQLWQCLAGHTAYAPDWAPGATDGYTLWKAYVPLK